MGDAFSIDPRRLLVQLVVEVSFSTFAALIALIALIALLLPYYLHGEWQPDWAVGSGVLAGAAIRRAVAPTYSSFPGFLRRPLALAVVVAATALVVSTTMAAPRYGGIFSAYLLAHYREALALLAVTVSPGLGAAVTEALGPDDEEFGEERLLAVARTQLGGGAEQVVAAVHAAVEAHTRGTPQLDDLTLLAVCLR